MKLSTAKTINQVNQTSVFLYSFTSFYFGQILIGIIQNICCKNDEKQTFVEANLPPQYDMKINANMTSNLSDCKTETHLRIHSVLLSDLCIAEFSVKFFLTQQNTSTNSHQTVCSEKCQILKRT